MDHTDAPASPALILLVDVLAAATVAALGVWVLFPSTPRPQKTAGGPASTGRVASGWDPKYRLRFGNDFPDSTFLGIHFPGLCGGMVATVLDYMNVGVAAPATTSTPPTEDGGLGAYIHDRQADSLLGANGARFVALLAASDDEVADTTDAELRDLRAAIDGGQPVPIGLLPAPDKDSLLGALVPPTDAHQVLAYGYGTWQGHEYVQVWDPNYPNAQSILTRQTDRTWQESGGGSKDRWRGLFVESGYTPKAPPGTTGYAAAALA